MIPYITNLIYTTQNHTHLMVKYAELGSNSLYTDAGNYLGKWVSNLTTTVIAAATVTTTTTTTTSITTTATTTTTAVIITN